MLNIINVSFWISKQRRHSYNVGCMTHASIEDLRQRAIALQEEEVQLVLQAHSLVESNPQRMHSTLKTLENTIRKVLRESNRLHQRISDLLGGKRLQELSDAQSLQQIVDCQQALVNLHSRNMRQVRELFAKGNSGR